MRVGRLLFLAALLANAAGAAEGPCDEFVLVRHGAALHPSAKATSVLAPGAACCSDAEATARSYWIMRFVAERGDFLELETLGYRPSSDHCETGFNPYLGEDAANSIFKYRLRVFVARGDVVPVLVTDFAQKYPDGTALKLETGSAVEAGGPEGEFHVRHSHWDVDVDRFSFEASVPASVVGFKYRLGRSRPKDEFELPMSDGYDYTLKSEGPFALDGKRVVSVRARAEKKFAGRRKANRVLLRERTSCAEVWFSVPLSDVVRSKPREDSEGGVVGGSLCGILRDGAPTRALAGARLFWPDGTRAGSLLQDDTLYGPSKKTPRGLTCFDVPIDQSRSVLPLCLEPEDLAPLPRCSE